MAAFQGPGLVLDAGGIAAACDTLHVHAAELWAVLTVETRGCGFWPIAGRSSSSSATTSAA